MTASLVTGALSLLFVSYLFIFQSAYDPDMEDVISEDTASVYVPDYDGAYFIIHDDGTCTLVPENGDPIHAISPSVIDKIQDSDVPIVWEE